MLQQGFNVDSSDYDGRTGLMLACVKGHKEAVDLLLAAGERERTWVPACSPG
jgi:ankyrin repeat protein